MTLYVDIVGPANAPTIVFLHGGGVSSPMWQPQVDRLKADYRCLVLDMPEHGKSMDEKPFTMSDAAARVAAIIRSQVDGGKAHVVGLSLGSQVGVSLLSTVPEVIDHLMLSGTLVHPIPGAGMLNAVAALYMPLRNIPFLVRANLKSTGLPDSYYEQFAADTRLLTAESFAHVMSENMSFKLPTGLDRVTVPVLVTIGEKEKSIMLSSARDLVKAIPKAQGRIAAKFGHGWNLEAPDLFTDTLRAWIEDKPLPAQLLPLG